MRLPPRAHADGIDTEAGETMVTIQAQVSIYPLRRSHVSPAVDAFVAELSARGLKLEPGPMSTLVAGEGEAVVAALRDAFARVADSGDAVMVVTVSNACPV